MLAYTHVCTHARASVTALENHCLLFMFLDLPALNIPSQLCALFVMSPFSLHSRRRLIPVLCIRIFSWLNIILLLPHFIDIFIWWWLFEQCFVQLLKNLRFMLYVCVFGLHVCVCTVCVQCLQRSEKGVRSPGTRVSRQLWGTLQVLRTELGFSEQSVLYPLRPLSSLDAQVLMRFCAFICLHSCCSIFKFLLEAVRLSKKKKKKK